jgi:Cd2+/Zn2+-exporting ATPase
MKEAGVTRQIMLTGDGRAAAESVGSELGISEIYSELLPADKVAKVEELLEAQQATKQQLAFVGDGINDAPVLARADVGIAMGSLGSDAAIEAADIVIMDDDLRKIPTAIRIAKKTLRIARQNIVFALGVKILILILGALGFANMWAAVFADVGVSMIAIINSMRLLKK